MDGAYDGMKLTCANQAILSNGGLGNGTGYTIPLEIKPSGQFEPLYRTTLNVQVCSHLVLLLIYSTNVSCLHIGFLLHWTVFHTIIKMFLVSFPFFPKSKDGELPVLPLSVYGAVAMAHSVVSEEYSSPNQFFFYLYDKRNVSSLTTRVKRHILIKSLANKHAPF